MMTETLPLLNPTDPQVRDLLMTRRRALIQELHALERFLGMPPSVPPRTKEQRKGNERKRRNEHDG